MTFKLELARSFPFEEATIEEIHTRLRARELTCAALVESFLARIGRYDMDASAGPALNAFVAVHPGVRERARYLDEAFERRELVGPLHGIPVLVKDTIDVHGLPTSMGAMALRDSRPPDDAFIVRKLLEAGAIIMGKTTMDELSSGASGSSSRSGIARNSYDTTKNASGSSSGSAVGISANFGVLAIGADSLCSIRSPASYNGIVGMRPTPGLISREGTIDGYAIEGVYGPMARTVTDLARLLDVIAVPDAADPQTFDAELRRPKTYADFRNPKGLQDLTVGVLRTYGGRSAWGDDHPELVSLVTRRAHANIIDDLKRLAARVVDPIHFEDFDYLRVVDATRTANDAYLQSFDAPYGSIFDVMSSGLVLPRNAFSWQTAIYRSISELHDNLALSSAQKRAAQEVAVAKLLRATGNAAPVTSAEIWRAVDSNPSLRALTLGPELCMRHKGKMRSALEDLMDRHGVDVLVYPETPYGPAYPEVGAGPVPVTGYNARLGTVTLMPSIVVPGGYGTIADDYGSGLDEPRPFGVEFMCRKYEDAKLIRCAYAYEHRTRHRRPPPIGKNSLTRIGPNEPLDIARFNAFKSTASEAFFQLQCSRTQLGDAELAQEFSKIITAVQL